MLEEITWTGKNKKEINKFLNKSEEKYEILTEDRDLLYINSVGGYINIGTKLFIYEKRIYIKKEDKC